MIQIQSLTHLFITRLKNSLTIRPGIALTASLITALNSGLVYAQDDTELNFYNIEVIVFKQSDSDYFKTETWDTDIKPANTDNSIDFSASPLEKRKFIAGLDKEIKQKAILFKSLNDKDKTLADTAESLEKSTRYEVLTYSLWQQPGLAENEALPVRITGGRSFRPVRDNEIILTDTSPSEKPDTLIPELDGTITIILSRFLHARTNLVLTQPAKWVSVESSTLQLPGIGDNKQHELQVNQQQELQLSNETQSEDTILFGFNLKNSRRMRSSELHHIDHPMFGVLIKISKAEIETNQPAQ